MEPPAEAGPSSLPPTPKVPSKKKKWRSKSKSRQATPEPGPSTPRPKVARNGSLSEKVKPKSKKKKSSGGKDKDTGTSSASTPLPLDAEPPIKPASSDAAFQEDFIPFAPDSADEIDTGLPPPVSSSERRRMFANYVFAFCDMLTAHFLLRQQTHRP